MASWTAGQMQQMQNQQWMTLTNTADSIGYITAGSVGGYIAAQMPPPPKPPESAVEWLDRRVREMRVSL